MRMAYTNNNEKKRLCIQMEYCTQHTGTQCEAWFVCVWGVDGKQGKAESLILYKSKSNIHQHIHTPIKCHLKLFCFLSFRSVPETNEQKNTQKLSHRIIFVFWIEHFSHFLFVRFPKSRRWWPQVKETERIDSRKEKNWMRNGISLALAISFSFGFASCDWFGVGFLYLISCRLRASHTQAHTSPFNTNEKIQRMTRCSLAYSSSSSTTWNGNEYIMNETAALASTSSPFVDWLYSALERNECVEENIWFSFGQSNHSCMSIFEIQLDNCTTQPYPKLNSQDQDRTSLRLIFLALHICQQRFGPSFRRQFFTSTVKRWDELRREVRNCSLAHMMMNADCWKLSEWVSWEWERNNLFAAIEKWHDCHS